MKSDELREEIDGLEITLEVLKELWSSDDTQRQRESILVNYYFYEAIGCLNQPKKSPEIIQKKINQLKKKLAKLKTV